MKLFLVGLLVLAGCADGDSPEAKCAGLAVSVCRETAPGEYKLDVGSMCGRVREPVEGEVAAELCDPARAKQAELAPRISDALADARACAVDADCRYATVVPTFAYGCAGAFNQGVDLAALDALLAEWQATTAQTPSCDGSAGTLRLACEHPDDGRAECAAFREP